MINRQNVSDFFKRHKYLRRLTKAGVGLILIDAFILNEQYSMNLRATYRGLTNAGIAFPVVGTCVYDYISTLKTLEYPSEEYLEARKGCHERSAEKILYLATTCGGIYFKAGQYLGTLERIVPKQYTSKLRQLQD